MVVYFAIILVYVATYFAASFTSPLPWTGRVNEYYNDQVLRQVAPIPGNFSADGSTVIDYTVYPDVSLIPEMVGWSAFIFFCVWLCMCNGVGITGRAVYVTMALPIVMTIVIIGRGVSLDGASQGIKMYFAEWNGGQLAEGQIWQTACGQVFFSTGVGTSGSQCLSQVKGSLLTAFRLRLLHLLCFLQSEVGQCRPRLFHSGLQ